MNILNWFKNCSGKATLSSARTLGAAAVIGVAGVAAWQIFSDDSGANRDTVFSAANEPEVVYVTGGAGGSADSSGSKEPRVSQEVYIPKTKNFPATSPENTSTVSGQTRQRTQDPQLAAFQMDGQFEGLQGVNRALEQASKNGGLPGELGFKMDGSVDIMSQLEQIKAQAQAKNIQEAKLDSQTEAQAQQQIQQALQDAALDKPAGKWDMSSGIARAKGHNLNGLPLQGSMTGSRRSGTLNKEDGADMIKGTVDRQDILGPVSQFEGGRRAVVEAGRRFSNTDNTLEGMRKISAEVADNPHRSDNEGSRALLGVINQSGGLRVVDLSGVPELQGSTTKEFLSSPKARLNVGGGAATTTIEVYLEAKTTLEKDLYDFAIYANRKSWTTLLLGLFSVAREAYLYLTVLPKYNDMKEKAEQFKETYKEFEIVNEEAGEQYFGDKVKDLAGEVYGFMFFPEEPYHHWKNGTDKWKEEESEKEVESNEHVDPEPSDDPDNTNPGSTGPNSPYNKSDKDGLVLE